MGIYWSVYLLIIFFSVTEVCRVSQKKKSLILVIVLLMFFTAFRGAAGADAENYINGWKMTATIWDTDISMNPNIAYSEPGYYFYTVILKSIWDNVTFYFFITSIITLWLLSKTLIKYSIYPFIGLIVYMSRFFLLRDFNQIRGALAIAIIILSTRYIVGNRFRPFIFCVLAALFFHTSIICIIPFFFFNKIRFSQKNIYIVLFCTYAFTALVQEYVGTILCFFSAQTGALSAYTDPDGMFAEGGGLLNPMIFYQIIILILYTLSENFLKERQPYYYGIRNAYLYSTILLMLFSASPVIAARLSTIFATYEIIIIPALISILTNRTRVVVVPIIFLLLGLLFYINYNRAGDLTYGLTI